MQWGHKKNIAEQIIDGKGDYILSLKGNHPKLLEEVKEKFDKVLNNGGEPGVRRAETDHGRIEKRQCYTIPFTHPDWKGLKQIVLIKSQRIVDEKEERESRYYLGSLDDSPEEYLRNIRSHWGIENTLHWSLDVTFKEDASRKRKGHSAENFAAIRKFVLGLLKMDTSKSSLKNKRLRAGWDDDFLVSLLSKI